MRAMGHEEPSPPLKLCVGYRLGKETFAIPRDAVRYAPIADPHDALFPEYEITQCSSGAA